MEDAKSELEDRWKVANEKKKIPETQQINFTDPDSCIMTTNILDCYTKEYWSIQQSISRNLKPLSYEL